MEQTYVSQRVIGPQPTLPIAVSTHMPSCSQQPADQSGLNYEHHRVLSKVVVAVTEREDGKGYDINDIGGRSCHAILYGPQKNHVKNLIMQDVVGRGETYWPKPVKKFTFQCPDEAVITEAGISLSNVGTRIGRISFRCQDLNSTIKGQQVVDPFIVDETNTLMPADFVVGLADLPIDKRTRCEETDVPIGFATNTDKNVLNGLAFECARLDVPLPAILAEPPPVDKVTVISHVVNEEPAVFGNARVSVAEDMFVGAVAALALLLAVAIALCIFFGVKWYRLKKGYK
jgi:hypothetical protein